MGDETISGGGARDQCFSKCSPVILETTGVMGTRSWTGSRKARVGVPLRNRSLCPRELAELSGQVLPSLHNTALDTLKAPPSSSVLGSPAQRLTCP